VSDDLKESWEKLSLSVQEKLTTSSLFQTLTDDELLSLDSHLLAELKSVAGMTSHQLAIAKEIVHNMSASYLSDFFQNIGAGTVVQSMSEHAFGALSWTSDQVSQFKVLLESSEAWGQASNWTSAQITSLGSMLSGLDLETINSLSDAALAGASNLAQLDAQVLVGLREKFQGMSVSSFSSVLQNVSVHALTRSVGNWGSSGQPWGNAKVAKLINRLQEYSVWGKPSGWTAMNISALGNMISDLDTETLKTFASSALANTANLKNLGVEQLCDLKRTFADMSSADFITAISDIDAAALKASVTTWGSEAVSWGFAKVARLVDKLEDNSAFGNIAVWTGANVSALGNMLTWMPVAKLLSIADSALANATNLARMSAAQINAVGPSIAGMTAVDFGAVLTGLDPWHLHAAMLAQCEITCSRDSDEIFLRDPTVTNAMAALENYSRQVASKAAEAAMYYALDMCNGSDIDETMAEARAILAACNGSAASDNVASSAFKSWDRTQQKALLQRLAGTDVFGGFAELAEENVASLCGQYAALTPANIALIGGSALISTIASAALAGATAAAFGTTGASVLTFGVAQAAGQITSEQRQAWAGKLKEGLGDLASWACPHVASAREIAAGMAAEDLSSLPVDAAKGLLANAVKAMVGEQVAGFSPAHILSMATDARDRLSGERLSVFDSGQMVAAVCGIALERVMRADASCPRTIVDTELMLAEDDAPDAGTIIASFASASSDSLASVRILSMLSEAERPRMGARTERRLVATANTEVTVRISFAEIPIDLEGAVVKIQATADALAAAHNGIVSMAATQFSVLPPTTTTSTTTTATGATTSTTAATKAQQQNTAVASASRVCGPNHAGLVALVGAVGAISLAA